MRAASYVLVVLPYFAEIFLDFYFGEVLIYDIIFYLEDNICQPV